MNIYTVHVSDPINNKSYADTVQAASKEIAIHIVLFKHGDLNNPNAYVFCELIAENMSIKEWWAERIR